jgi:hypothetical protein
VREGGGEEGGSGPAGREEWMDGATRWIEGADTEGGRRAVWVERGRRCGGREKRARGVETREMRVGWDEG